MPQHALMDDRTFAFVPRALDAIAEDTHALSFTMASDRQTGALLRTLAASKRGGRMLELGTGTGLATAWLLAGMDAEARLTSVDTDPMLVEVARQHLGGDARVKFVVDDAGEYLRGEVGPFDLIFADAWPGKYSHLDRALELLAPGGLYVIDDMLPQPNWPEGHGELAERLIATLEARADLAVAKLGWSTGLMVATRR